MKFDIVLAGVGGQGGLSSSVVIASAAMEEGLHVKQSEVHGMSQRGGDVQASLRLSDQPIASPLIPLGTAQLILGFEPLEGLRYLSVLAPSGRLICSRNPVLNIPDYPPIEELLARMQEIPGSLVLDAEGIAREAGSVRAANMVLLGAASSLLPFETEKLEGAIARVFGSKGERIVEANLKAFAAGRLAAKR